MSGTVLSTLHVLVHALFYKWGNRDKVTCPRSHSKLIAEVFNIRKFGSKTHALNYHDILTPKHELYLHSLTASKMIKEKQNEQKKIINFLLLRSSRVASCCKCTNTGLLEKWINR